MGQFTINKGDFPAVATFDFPPESVSTQRIGHRCLVGG